MKTEKREKHSLPAWMLDPRWDRPLLILVVLLSLLLAALILQPRLGHLVTAPAEEAPEAEEIRLRIFPAVTPEPLRLSADAYGWQQNGSDLYYVNQDGGLAYGLQRIDGRLHYFLPDGRRARALGVDVSYYNEDVDWTAVKEQGIDFAIIRLGGRGWTYGRIYTDTRHGQFLHNAREAGLNLGVYFYSTAGTEAEAAREARAVLRWLDGQTLQLPVFIDVEESGEYPKGRADLLGQALRTRVVSSFCRVIEDGGYEAGIYSGHSFFNTALYFDVVGDRTVWLANYSASARNQLPSFNRHYEIWQFTDRGQVKGIKGPADLDVIF